MRDMTSNSLRVLILLLGISFCGTWQAEAQTRSRPTWLGLYGGHQEYRGDFGNEMLGFKIGYDWMLGVNLDQYLGSLFDLEFSAAYGELDYLNAFSTTVVSSNLMLNLKPFRSRFRLEPFIGTGLGLTSYRTASVNTENGLTLQVPVQVGITFPFTPVLAGNIGARYNRTFSSALDGSDFSNRKHDDFIAYTIGISFSLNRTRDKDGDGIADKDDLCPNNFGKSFWGCPDSDGDGLDDNEDRCPGLSGSRLMDGCPDTDGDGVDDTRDECPKLKGNYRFSGCPDDDNDGVPNPVDQCPDTRGTIEQKGCPDPNADTGQKPSELDESFQEKLTLLSEDITFSANSAVLDSASLNSIKQVSDIMLRDPDLRLIIRAYTDNTGTPNQNLELSIARANTVKTYLVNLGVPESKIYAFGYGEERPVATNDTPEGRAQNRRVELNLYYN